MNRHKNIYLKKIFAISEVLVVTFVLVPTLTSGVYCLFPSFETWQTDVGFPFPVFVYVVMILLALIIIKSRKKLLLEYGITFKPLKYHLDIAGTCFLPVALASFPFALGVDHKTWSGALILAVAHTALLFYLGWSLRKKAGVPGVFPTAMGVSALLPVMAVSENMYVKALLLFLTYAVFVGFGEEILYRGYMQSRLNEVFDKPYHFFGVALGWGWIITALLFGLTHVGLLRWALGATTEVTLAWGFWTVFSGLVFGFVREKTGGILAPALLHGLPQAIATAVMLFI